MSNTKTINKLTKRAYEILDIMHKHTILEKVRALKPKDVPKWFNVESSDSPSFLRNMDVWSVYPDKVIFGECFFTFVATDDSENPQPIPIELLDMTDDEIVDWCVEQEIKFLKAEKERDIKFREHRLAELRRQINILEQEALE